jgi:hypothetical protein
MDVGAADDRDRGATAVLVLDESVDQLFKIAGQIVVLKQNAVLEGLAPALDLSLSLGIISAPPTWEQVSTLSIGARLSVRASSSIKQ